MLPLAVFLLVSAASSAAPSDGGDAVSVPAPVPGSAWEPPAGQPAATAPPEPPEPGCAACKPDRCPRSAAECSVGAGLTPDPCGCCPGGACGLGEGARCYNATTTQDLADRALGACGDHMDCLVRSDLGDKDAAEALCACRDQGQVCGSDNATYASSCQMGRLRGPQGAGPPVTVWLKHRGPCRAAPWIVTPPGPVSYVLGSPVSLECEVKGYPAPAAAWERIGKDGIATPLPSDDASLVVMLRGGPEPFMASSWLQILALREEDVATYICVATNSEGVARAASEVTVMEAE